MLSSIYFRLLQRLFSKDEYEMDIVTIPDNNFYSSFQGIVLNYLTFYGIDERGNNTGKKIYPTKAQILNIKQSLKEYGIPSEDDIEKMVIDEFLEIKKIDSNLTPSSFAHWFENKYFKTKGYRINYLFSNLYIKKHA